MDRNDFKQLTALRLAEAQTLLNAGHSSGAYYLSGYVIECALKACVSKLTNRHEFPDLPRAREAFTHDLSQLIKAAGLARDFDGAARSDAQFGVFWSVIKDWSEQSRYRTYSATEASDIFQAVSDTRHGVLRWIKRYW